MASQKTATHNPWGLQVVPDGKGKWAVLAMRIKLCSEQPTPSVLYSGLSTHEVAETALADAWACMMDYGIPYGPYQEPEELVFEFEAAGRILAEFRALGIKSDDDVAAANRIAKAVRSCIDLFEEPIPF